MESSHVPIVSAVNRKKVKRLKSVIKNRNTGGGAGVSESAKGQIKPKAKTWCADEETGIAQYVADKYTHFKSSKRIDFLRHMISDLKLNCDEDQLKNKVTRMEKLYKSVKEKCGKTGEGLTEETIEYQSWERYVKSQCNFFFILDSVMDTRVNIEPPLEFASGSNNNASAEARNIEIDTINDMNNSNHSIMDDELLWDDANETTDVPVKLMTLTSTKKQKCGSSSVAEAMTLQANITSEHYKRLDDQKLMELNLNGEKIKLEDRKLDLAEKKQNRKYDLLQLQITKNFELEELRFQRQREQEMHEIEKLKLQIELARLTK